MCELCAARVQQGRGLGEEACTGRGEACSGGERGRVEQEARGARPGARGRGEREACGPGRAAEEGEKGGRREEKKRRKGKRKMGERKRKGGGRERGLALAGEIRGGRCDPVGHAQCCVRARMRPQEKDRGRESDVRNGERDSGKGLGF